MSENSGGFKLSEAMREDILANGKDAQGRPLAVVRLDDQRCLWCGEPYAEHVESRGEGEPVPRMPCQGLKSGFRAAAQPAATGLERVSSSPSAPELAAAAPELYRRLLACVAIINAAHFNGTVPDRHSEPILGDLMKYVEPR